MKNNLMPPRTIGELIDSAVNPRLIIPKGEIEKAPNPTHEQIRAISREIGFAVPKNVIAEIAELDNRFQSVVAQLEANTDRAALENFRSHSTERDEKILNTEDVSHHSGLTLEDFKRVAREKMLAAKRLMQRHGQQAFEICSPYLKKLAESIYAEADRNALYEISRCEAYGFPWKASDKVVRLYRAAQIIEDRLNHYRQSSGERPKVIADFIYDLD